MGGFVNIAIRKGGVLKQLKTHTSWLSHLRDMDIFEKELNSKLLKDFNLQDQKWNGPFPEGYGLVVVDFDTKWIGHSQSYTDLGSFGAFNFSFSDLNRYPQRAGKSTSLFLLEKAWSKGAVKKLEYWENSQKLKSEKDLDELNLTSFTQLIDLLKKDSYANKNLFERASGFHLRSLSFSPPGWTIERYNKENKESPKTWPDMVETLINKDFELIHVLPEWQEVGGEEITHFIIDKTHSKLAKKIPLSLKVSSLKKVL